jgi:hypothetical protein
MSFGSSKKSTLSYCRVREFETERSSFHAKTSVKLASSTKGLWPIARLCWVVSQSEICAAGRLRGSPLWPRSIRGPLAGLAEFELFFVEDMEHSRKCGMIRLNNVTDGSRPVCENRDDEARIFITVSFPHPVPDPEFCGHVPRVAGASARSELCVAARAPPLRGQARVTRGSRSSQGLPQLSAVGGCNPKCAAIVEAASSADRFVTSKESVPSTRG